MVQQRLDEGGLARALPQQRAVLSKECLKLKDQHLPTMDPGAVFGSAGRQVRSTELPLVGVNFQIDKADWGDSNGGLSMLFQRSQERILIRCRLFDQWALCSLSWGWQNKNQFSQEKYHLFEQLYLITQDPLGHRLIQENVVYSSFTL